MLNTGAKVLIKKRRTINMHSCGYMDKYLNKIMTIRLPYDSDNTYSMYEDINDPRGARMNGGWYWEKDDFEKVVNI